MRRPVISLLVPLHFFFLPVSSGWSQTNGAQAAYAQAVELLESGKNAEALAVLEAATAAASQDPSLYNLRGVAASALGRDKEAEESFRTVIHLTPKSPMG